MPYLFGIYLFHGSLILLLFANRMSSVPGGPNESVERACEVIIRAHEACIVTLNTEFQRVFRKVMRITLLLVQAQARRALRDRAKTTLELGPRTRLVACIIRLPARLLRSSRFGANCLDSCGGFVEVKVYLYRLAGSQII